MTSLSIRDNYILLKVRFEDPTPLRSHFPSELSSPRTKPELKYRTVEIHVDATVDDVLRQLKERYYPNNQKCAFGLFLPDNPECPANNSPGRWLQEDKSLRHYNLDTSSRVIVFKNLLRSLKVKDLDGGLTKTILVNKLTAVADLVTLMCVRFSLPNSYEYSLQYVDQKTGVLRWIDEGKTLSEQGLTDTSLSSVILRQKYFVSTAASTANPSSLHFLYIECRNAIVNGKFARVSRQRAVTLAALQAQVTYRNYDPLVHVAGLLVLSDFLPEAYRDVGFIEEDIYQHHRKLKDCKDIDAKLRYVRMCCSFPAFGFTRYSVKKKVSASGGSFDHDVLIGVDSESIQCFHPEKNQTVLTKSDIHAMKDGSDVTIDAHTRVLAWRSDGSGTNSTLYEVQFERSDDIEHFMSMLRGYKRIREMQRNGSTALTLSPRMLRGLSVPASSSLSPGMDMKKPFVSSSPTNHPSSYLPQTYYAEHLPTIRLPDSPPTSSSSAVSYSTSTQQHQHQQRQRQQYHHQHQQQQAYATYGNTFGAGRDNSNNSSNSDGGQQYNPSLHPNYHPSHNTYNAHRTYPTHNRSVHSTHSTLTVNPNVNVNAIAGYSHASNNANTATHNGNNINVNMNMNMRSNDGVGGNTYYSHIGNSNTNKHISHSGNNINTNTNSHHNNNSHHHYPYHNHNRPPQQYTHPHYQHQYNHPQQQYQHPHQHQYTHAHPPPHQHQHQHQHQQMQHQQHQQYMNHGTHHTLHHNTQNNGISESKTNNDTDNNERANNNINPTE